MKQRVKGVPAFIGAAALSAALLVSCGGGDDKSGGTGNDAPSGARAEAMAQVADDGAAMMMALPEVADQATTAIETACASGDAADFEVALERLEAAQSGWHETEAFWMGPVTDRRSNALVDWPAGDSDIDDLLAADEPATIDADYLAEFVGADTRGYGAAAYLLADAPIEGRACDFAVASAELSATEIEAVGAAWNEPAEGEPYRDELADQKTGINVAVNHLIVLLANNEPDFLAERAASSEALLFGVDGKSGLAAMVDDDLTARMRTEADALLAAADAADPAAGPDAAPDATPDEATRAAADELRATIATEMVAELGVTVTFSDADGDSAG